MKKAVHVYFEGMVQGVGFRFTARHLASKYRITGWVKNMPNGRVEVVAEGEAEDLDSFLSDLHQDFKRYIIDYTIEKLVAFGEYKNFDIRF